MEQSQQFSGENNDWLGELRAGENIGNGSAVFECRWNRVSSSVLRIMTGLAN
jgi:hypothetical protein